MFDTKEAQKSKPLGEVNDAFQEVVKTIREKAIGMAQQKVSEATEKLTDIAAGGGDSKGKDESGAGMFQRAFSGVKQKAKSVVPGASNDNEG